VFQQDENAPIDIFGKVRLNLVHYVGLDMFLIWAYKECGDEGIRAMAVSVLDEIDRRKRSSLGDPDIKSTLNLPYIFEVVTSSKR